MSATLHLGLAAPAPKNATASPVSARIQGILSSLSTVGDVIVKDVVIPASGTIDVPLNAGSYTVQLTMPSGRIIEESCDLADGQELPMLFAPTLEDERGFSLQESASTNVAQVLDNVVQARSWEKAAEAILGKLPVEMQSEVRGSDLMRSLGDKTERELTRLRDRLASPAKDGGLRKQGEVLVSALARSVLKAALRDVLPDEKVDATTEAVDYAAAASDDLKIGLKLGELRPLPDRDIWLELASGDAADALASPWTKAPPPAERDAAYLWRLERGFDAPQSRPIGLAKDGEGGFELLSIPAPWFCAAGHEFSPIDILIDSSICGAAKSSIAVHDKMLEGVLAYLDRGRLAAARPLVEELDRSNAIDNAIAGKMDNPLAACAAAYVGLAIFAPGESERWDSWLPNLINRFPDIPDAAIVHARRIVLRPGSSDENTDALAALKQAYKSGLPYFGVGVQLLREMLTLFPGDPDAEAMLEAVAGVASRVDQNQMFTVLRYPKV